MVDKADANLARYDDLPDFKSKSPGHIPQRSSYDRLVNFQQGLVSTLDEGIDAVSGSVKQAYNSGLTVGGVIQGDQQAIKDFNENARQTYVLANQLMDPKVLAAAGDAVKTRLMEAGRAIAQGDDYAAGAAFGAVLKDVGAPKTALNDLLKKAATVARHPMESAATLLEGGKISDVDKHVEKLKNMRLEDNIKAANTPHPGAPTEDVINSLHSSAIMKEELEGAKARAAARETMGKWELLLTNARENIGWGALVSRRDQDRLLLAGEKGQTELMQTMAQITAEKMAVTKVAVVPVGIVGASMYYGSSGNPKNEKMAESFQRAHDTGFTREKTMNNMNALKDSGPPEMKDAVALYVKLYEHLEKDGEFSKQNGETMRVVAHNIAEKLKAGEPVVALGPRAGVDASVDQELAMVK